MASHVTEFDLPEPALYSIQVSQINCLKLHPKTYSRHFLSVIYSEGKKHAFFASVFNFGFGHIGLSADDFTKPDNVIQLGHPPVRIDIITSISGVSWQEASKAKIKGKYGSIPVFFLSRRLLISNKRAIGRKKDKADLEALGEP